MSVEGMAVVLHHSKMEGTAKLVMVGIANHAGDGGAWPSIATLAKYTNATDRTVQRAIRVCEEAGELEVHDQAGGNGATDPRYRPNRYTILVVCPLECDGSTNHRPRGDIHVTPTDPGVTSVVVRGAIHGHPGVTPVSPEPSLEPSLTVRRGQRRRRTEIPPGWNPSEATRAWARTEYPDHATKAVLAAFIDHAGSTGRLLVDWDLGFRNWIRNEAKYHAAKVNAGPARTFL